MQKILKKIVDNKYSVLCLLFIILSGLILRLIGINKPEGLWCDELYSYYTSLSLQDIGVLGLLKQTAIPLYYLSFYFWIDWCGNQDIILRLFSVLFGILTIPVIFLAGKELLNKKIGLIAAGLVAVNSFAIYYSQEVRYYSFLMFLASVFLLFLIKIFNNPTRFNYICLILAAIGIALSFPIGFLYVFIQLFVVGIYFKLKDKNKFNKFVKYNLILLGFLSPYLIALAYNIFFLQGQVDVIPVFFSFVNIIVLAQNWFSPEITGLVNVNPLYYQEIFKNTARLGHYIVFLIIPVALSLFALFKAAFKEKINMLLFISAFLFLGVEIIATMLGKFVLLSKYTIIFLPIVILLAAYGLASLKNKFVSYFLVFILIGINVFYIFSSPFSAPKKQRVEALKSVAYILENYDLSSEDLVFMPYGGALIDKYFDKSPVMEFQFSETFAIKNKKGRHSFEKLFKSEEKITGDKIYDRLKYFINNNKHIDYFEDYFLAEGINKLKKDGYFVIVSSKNIAVYGNKITKIDSVIDKILKKQPVFFLYCSKITQDAIELSSSNLKLIKKEERGVWEVYIFKKS